MADNGYDLPFGHGQLLFAASAAADISRGFQSPVGRASPPRRVSDA